MSTTDPREWSRYLDRLARAVVDHAERQAAAAREVHLNPEPRENVRWRTRVYRWWTVSAPEPLWNWLEEAELGERVTFWWQVLQARLEGHNPGRFEVRGWTVRVDDE